MELPKDEMQKVVDYLDQLMEQEPSRELADASNFLQAMLNDA